ncbi:MAG: hypothetical protein KDA61_21360 [Planctomycetales bacterium]|nr:hypothetical protein [Planctomycetales bacterium]
MSKTIYTWRNVACSADIDTPRRIEWKWEGWRHAAVARNHVREARTLWKNAFGAAVVESLIETADNPSLAMRHEDLQRLASVWEPELRRVFALPRLLRTAAQPRGRVGAKPTPVVQIATRFGMVFVIRRSSHAVYRLTTFFFVEPLVVAPDPEPGWFERVAVEHLVDMYTRHSARRLPSPTEPKHRLERRWEVDRGLQFLAAELWGFASSEPGAVWKGWPDDFNAASRGDDALVDERTLGAVDAPPAAIRQERGSSDE